MKSVGADSVSKTKKIMLAMRTELVYNQICPFRTTLFASITTHI